MSMRIWRGHRQERLTAPRTSASIQCRRSTGGPTEIEMNSMTKRILASIALVGTMISAALAGEVEATIVEIRPDSSTLILSDGASYLIPVDFYVDDLKPGMKVLAFYDEDTDGRTLTDVQIQE
ncbi:MAG: hypothetical protein CMN87_06520 [Stappia sp.]|nr:hypothetical protein [Stappia sp.]MBM19645.1 hypothetical protein [Stappia sp.]